MLDQEELRRRVRAGRLLADISQAEMNAAGHSRGLGKHELGNAERGDITIRHFHLPMLCEILEVPMSWFTEPRKVIVAQKAADYVVAVRELLELVTGETVSARPSTEPAAGDDFPEDLPEAPSSPRDARAGRGGSSEAAG